MRFLFYSHDGLGLGHTRRNLAIARALTRLAPNASVLLATGVEEVGALGLPANVGTLKLPSLQKTANGSYIARRLHIPAEEIRALRSAVLTTTVESYRPAVVLTDKHPFGAGGEFRKAVECARAQGARLALGLRDILDQPERVREEWSGFHLLDDVAAWYDLVLIYGHATVFDPIAAYGFTPEVAARTRFCGYVINEEEHPQAPRADIRWAALELERRDRPVVLATTGGGEDGFFVSETFIRASAGAPWQGVVVAGPMTPDHEFKTLRRLADEARVHLHTFVPNLASLFWSVDALVSMGGYNTLGEALSKGLPVVCVPRVSPRCEQLLRAQAFERLDLLQMLHPYQLNLELLRDKVQAALSASRRELLDRVNATLSVDGARHAARQLLALATRRPGETGEADTP
jgi:predicted glycosyltransferase